MSGRRTWLDSSLLCVAFSLIVVLAFGSWAEALMLKLSLTELTAGADAVVVGRVSSTESYWNADHTLIHTVVTVEVEERLAGAAPGETVAVVVLGGRVGNTVLGVSDVPRFVVGERAVLFLAELARPEVSGLGLAPRAELPPQVYEVFGQFQGKLDLRDDEAGGVPLSELRVRLAELPPEGETVPLAAPTDTYPRYVTQPTYVLGEWRWPGDWPEVTYKVHTSFTSAQRTAIQNSAATWTDAGARFIYTYDGTHSRPGGAAKNGVNEVLWDDLGAGGVLGRAYFWAEGPEGGPLHLVEADTAFNTRHTFSTSTPPTANDLESVSLHEFGHWLVLEHTDVSEAVMWFQLMTGTAKRSLHSDDVAGIKAIYGVPPEPSVPAAPTLVSPASGAQVSGSSITFQWNAVATATQYFLRVATASDFDEASWFYSQNVGNTTSQSVPGFPGDGTVYYWSVVARNEAGWGTWAPSRSFTNGTGLAAPTLVAPASGASVAGTSIQFQWSTVSGATKYRVEVSASPTFGTLIAQGSDLTSTSATWHGAPADGSVLYWRVRAETGTLTGPWSAVWSFTSGAPPSGVELRQGYNLIGMSWQPASSVLAEVFSITPVPDFVSLFWWDPVAGGYRASHRGTLTQVEKLRGYWLFVQKTPPPAQYTLEIAGTALTGEQRLTLGPPGFQMIGVPYPTAWGPATGGSLRVRLGAQERSLAEALATGWLYFVLFEWNPLTYSWVRHEAADGVTLQPGKGYFLYAVQPGLELIFSEASVAWPAGGLALSQAALVFDPGEPPEPPLAPDGLPAKGLTVAAYPSPAGAGEGVTFTVRGPLAELVEAIQVRVHDLSGRLVYQGQSTGTDLTWDRGGASGGQTASGVLLYQVEALLGGQWVSLPVEKILILR